MCSLLAVFEMMARRFNGENWPEIFMKVVPKRFGVTPIGDSAGVIDMMSDKTTL